MPASSGGRSTHHSTQLRRSVKAATPRQPTLLTLALAGALAAPHAWALDTPGSSSSTYTWSNGTDPDVLIGNGVIITVTTATALKAVSGTLGTLTNNGILDSPYSGGSNAPGISISSGVHATLISNGATGSIDGLFGIINAGTVTTLSNDGTITGAFYAIENQGSIATLNNTQVIHGSSAGILNDSGHAIGTLSNSGIISGFTGVYNKGTLGAFSNSGTITGFINQAVFNSNALGTLSNTGVLTSGLYGVFGIRNQNTGSNTIATIGILNNSGTIYGSIAGIFNDGTIGTLNNSGQIAGQTYAITITSSGAIGTLINSGTIAGGIDNNGLSALTLTIYGGSGGTFGTLTGFGGGIGNINVVGNIAFAGGNQLLNDNVNSYSGGTVTNLAGALQVNQPITISGNYVQDAAATLVIGVSSGAVASGTVSADSGYGRLVVNGDAYVQSGSTVTLKKLTTYSYAVGQRYVVIQANNDSNTNYNAASLNYSVAGYTASGTQVVDSDSSAYSDLVMTITGVSGGAHGNPATTRNAGAVLDGLFNYSGTNQSLLNVFNPALAIGDAAGANHAGAQLSPAATNAAAINGSMAAFGAVQGAAGNRLDAMRTASAGSGVSTGETTRDAALWGRLFGGMADQGARDGISGYHAHYSGLALGGDAQVRENWRAGGLFSYARTNVGNDGDNSGSSAYADSYGLTAYAGYDGRPWYVNLSAGVARQQYAITRAVSFTGFDGVANGAFNGMLYTATAQAGYPLALGAGTITPLAGMSYSTLRQNGYTETGGSGAALAVNGASYTSLKSQLGVKYERGFPSRYGELKPFMQLGWNHEFRNGAPTTSASFAADTTGSTAFTTQGPSPVSDTAVLSVGATLVRSGNLSVSASYTLEGARGYTAQAGNLTLRWRY